jgi:hypothetical protein
VPAARVFTGCGAGLVRMQEKRPWSNGRGCLRIDGLNLKTALFNSLALALSLRGSQPVESGLRVIRPRRLLPGCGLASPPFECVGNFIELKEV